MSSTLMNMLDDPPSCRSVPRHKHGILRINELIHVNRMIFEPSPGLLPMGKICSPGLFL